MGYTFKNVKEILTDIRKIQTEIKKLRFELNEILSTGDLSAITYEEKIKGYSEHKGVERSIIKIEEIQEEIERQIKDKEILLKRFDISLGVLNEIEKKVIVMGYYDGKSDTAISYAINRNNQSVCLIRRRAINKMVEILNL